MTAPIRQEVTMGEIEAEIKAAESTNTDGIKLEGTDIPEEFRGKTVSEVLKLAKASREALTISEEARKSAATAPRSDAGPTTIVMAPPAPVEDKRLSKEELAGLFESDPIGAVAYMQEIAVKDAEVRFERRLAPMSAGAASAAEGQARQRYGDEFALFETEIKKIADAIPNKAFLGTPEGWDQVIGFVRGNGENFNKLVEHRTKKTAAKAVADAQEIQARSAGFSPTSSIRGTSVPSGSTSAGDDAGLDEVERQIADKFVDQGVFKNRAEYKKWKDIGG